MEKVVVSGTKKDVRVNYVLRDGSEYKVEVLSIVMRKIVSRLRVCNQSTGNGSMVLHSFQMLHTHVFLVAPLCACDVSQAGTDQH